MESFEKCRPKMRSSVIFVTLYRIWYAKKFFGKKPTFFVILFSHEYQFWKRKFKNLLRFTTSHPSRRPEKFPKRAYQINAWNIFFQAPKTPIWVPISNFSPSGFFKSCLKFQQVFLQNWWTLVEFCTKFMKKIKKNFIHLDAVKPTKNEDS